MPHRLHQIPAGLTQSMVTWPLAMITAVAFITLANVTYADTNIVWSDEFNGVSLDTNKWTYDTDNGFWVPNPGYWVPGWGNNELEYYTSRTNNVYVAGGYLHIHAQREAYEGFNFTSGRIKTLGLYFTNYGRFEWRAQLPGGTGTWPAVWMLPENSPYGGWPNSGEIDVVENNGANTASEGATIHYGGAHGNDVYSGLSYNFPTGQSVTGFHTYDLDWASNSIKFSVDGNLFETQTSWYSNIGTNTTKYPFPAPFNVPFYFLMNLAIGGNYLNNPSTNSINPSLPAEMLVDYVRVYEQTAPLAITVTPQSDGSLSLLWPAGIVCHLQSAPDLTGTSWADVPGGTTNPFVVVPDPTSSGVFYRLESP